MSDYFRILGLIGATQGRIMQLIFKINILLYYLFLNQLCNNTYVDTCFDTKIEYKICNMISIKGIHCAVLDGTIGGIGGLILPREETEFGIFICFSDFFCFSGTYFTST